MICSGFRTACLLLGAVFAERGLSEIAIEDPSLAGIDRPWTTAGQIVSDIPVDGDGADVSRLDGGTDAALLTPSRQFPLGGALNPSRRQHACAWATGGEHFIVEDDYDGEFRFDRRPIAALQRSAPEHVIYAGSASKALDPSLRLGWLALPAELAPLVAEASETLTGGVPLLNQLALAEFIRTGDYERHIRRQRREYARRRDLLQRALRAAGYEVPGIPAGLHICSRCGRATSGRRRGDGRRRPTRHAYPGPILARSSSRSGDRRRIRHSVQSAVQTGDRLTHRLPDRHSQPAPNIRWTAVVRLSRPTTRRGSSTTPTGRSR